MSYSIEILEWFSRRSKRNLRIFEATILETEDPNKENTGPPVFSYSAKGKPPDQKSYKLPFTMEGLQKYKSAELQNYLLANPEIVTQIVPGPNIHKPQKVDLGNNKTLWVWKSEGDGSGDTPQEKPEEQEAAIDPTIQQPVSLFVTEANRVVDDLGKAHNSDGGLLARAKRLIKKVMEERKNKDLTNTDESYIRLMSDGIGKFIERFLGDGQHSLRRKILDASVQRTRLADGTYVEASDEERARMVSQVFDHLSKLLSSDKMTASDRQKYKDSVKIVKSPTTNGRYRILIYSEDKSLAISLPYAGISRAVFEGLAIEKFKDSKQELKALDVETYSNAYSGVFGNILEQLTVARVQLNNARADLEKCKDENYRKILAQRCANLGEKIKQLDNEFSERVKTLVVNVRELANLAVDQQAALGSAEYIEGISQAIAELTPILGDQYKDQLKQLEKLTEKEKKEETKNLFVKLCNKVAGMVMFYSADFNKALANADHAVGVGGKVKGGGRRQDIRYFYADENKAKEAADFLGMKLQEIDISDVEELKRLIPEDRGGFDLDYLINKAKSNGETKIYMLEDSIKNSLDSDGNTKLATIKSQHHTIETNFMITALEKGFDSPEAKLAMEEYNKFVTEKLNAVPLTQKEFEDRLGSVRSRLGKLFTPEGTTANEADINRRIVKALKESNRRSARLVEIGNDTAEKITRTIGGKEVTGQKLTMVAGMLKKACSELGIPTDEETFSRLTSEDDTDVEYGRLRDILKDIDNPSKYEENPEYATQCVQKALNFLMNEASARKIRSGNIEEAEVLAATMFSKLGVSIDDLPISHTNYGSRTVGVASHNGILEHFAQAIIGMARTKGANKDHKIFVTADGIRISTEKEASRSDPDAPTQDASLTITTKFTGSSKSGGETVGVVNKAGMIALSHRRNVYDVQGSDTNRSKIGK